jgi:hypothetical protein
MILPGNANLPIVAFKEANQEMGDPGGAANHQKPAMTGTPGVILKAFPYVFTKPLAQHPSQRPKRPFAAL